MPKFITNCLIISPLFFLFLPSFFIPFIGIPVYDIVISISLLVLFIYYKKSYSILYSCTKYRFFRILLFLSLWIILSGLFLVITGQYRIDVYLFSVFLWFLYNNLTWYIYPAIVFPNLFPLKKVINILLIGIYIICVYGLIQYLTSKAGIPIFDWLQNIIVNRRSAEWTDLAVLNGKRLYSVFEEPGYFGGFLCTNLPLIYTIINSKYKLFKNIYLNYFIKKSYIPIIWITIFCIKSPIWIILSLVVTSVYYYKRIIRNLKIFIVFILIFSISFTLIMLYVKSSDISDTFMNRIQKVAGCIKNPTQMVVEEPSLFNRIIHYKARIDLFKNYPITGIGYKNAEYHSYNLILHSNLPLTLETQKALQNEHGGKIGMNGAMFWNLLSDTGIVGFILFYSFLILSIIKLTQILNFLPKSLEKTFIIGLQKSYITLIMLSFYDLRLNVVYYWFLFGLTISAINYFKYNNGGLRIRNDIN